MGGTDDLFIRLPKGREIRRRTCAIEVMLGTNATRTFLCFASINRVPVARERFFLCVRTRRLTRGIIRATQRRYAHHPAGKPVPSKLEGISAV